MFHILVSTLCGDMHPRGCFLKLYINLKNSPPPSRNGDNCCPQVRRSFMIEANVTNAAEQLTVMDYFFYGREKFTEEELEFVNSKYSPH